MRTRVPLPPRDLLTSRAARRQERKVHAARATHRRVQAEFKLIERGRLVALVASSSLLVFGLGWFMGWW